MGIFDKRVAFKPFEYPDVVKYKDAINHSYWLVSEWNFLSDIHDFHVKLDPAEQNAVRNTLLAISQIEVAVKKFWAKLGDRFPKPELDQVGITFGESEVRHADAYSHLLQVLGLNQDFSVLLENPAILGRVEYLTKYLSPPPRRLGLLRRVWAALTGRRPAPAVSDKDYTLTLALFSIFVENVSLFSQFVIIKSFNKYRTVLKDIDNVVQATQKEEVIHAMFGVWLVEKIREENPDWFDDEFYGRIDAAAKKAYEAEGRIIDWIFEQGELSFLPKDTVKEFVKHRLNESVEMIGGKKVFEVDADKVAALKWFDDEIYAEVNTDFFHKKPVTYSKKVQSIKAEDLF